MYLPLQKACMIWFDICLDMTPCLTYCSFFCGYMMGVWSRLWAFLATLTGKRRRQQTARNGHRRGILQHAYRRRYVGISGTRSCIVRVRLQQMYAKVESLVCLRSPGWLESCFLTHMDMPYPFLTKNMQARLFMAMSTLVLFL